MNLIIGCVLIFGSVTASMVHAQFGVPWRHAPTIVVIGSETDTRLSFVDEAVSFWNKNLEEVGSAFRLGPVTRLVRPVPEEALQALSRSVVDGQGGAVSVPQSLRGLPGDLTILLGSSNFVSFAGPFDTDSKRAVGIRNADIPPLSLPNVARNVIAHELGHAIGLGHNADPTNLMCGRPAACRPGLFRSDESRMFPLTDDEKRRLLVMYPPEWKPMR